MKRLAGLLIVCAAVGLTQGSASANHLHPCGDLDNNRFDVKADFACSKAFRVVRNLDCSGNCGNDDFFSGKFKCRVRDTGYESARIKCKHKDKQVRWNSGS